jgi:hypothetical protein
MTLNKWLNEDSVNFKHFLDLAKENSEVCAVTGEQIGQYAPRFESQPPLNSDLFSVQ